MPNLYTKDHRPFGRRTAGIDRVEWRASVSDSFVAAGLRQNLALQLAARGSISSAAVATAVRRVPRHLFAPHVSVREAYADQVIQTKAAGGETLSTLSQPSAIVTMLEQLRLERGMRVLEIGAGTGYNAALLAEVVGDDELVTSVDIDADMVNRAQATLRKAGHPRVRVKTADGFSYSTREKVERIELSVEAPFISPHWVDSLEPGGMLVLPLRTKGVQYVTPALRKEGQGLVSETVSCCSFMPLRGKAEAHLAHYHLPKLGEMLFTWEGPDEFPAGGLTRAFKGKRSRHDLGELPLAGLAFAMLTDDWSFSVANKGSKAGGRATLGLYDPNTGSVCLVAPGPAPGTAAVECCGGDGGKRRLLLGLEKWSALGRPGPERLSMRAYRKGAAPPPPDGWKVVIKPFFDLHIAYCT